MEAEQAVTRLTIGWPSQPVMVWPKSAWAGGHRQRPDSVERPEGSFYIVTLPAPSSPLPTAGATLRLTARRKGSPRLQRWLRPAGDAASFCQTWWSGAAPRVLNST